MKGSNRYIKDDDKGGGTMHERELKQVLDQWVGRDVVLTKQEDGDIDQTVMSLEHVTYVGRGETIDGYVSSRALQLRGEGTVQTAGGERQPLPFARYDIPLTDDCHIQHNQNTILIETERAEYTVTPRAST